MTDEGAATRRHLRILVVDDDPLIRAALIRVLESDGHEVFWSANGTSALRQMRTEIPDVVILDMLLGPNGPDGWSVLREKVSSDALRAIPVIILTGLPTVDVHSGATAIDRALAGTVMVLGKPLDAAALRQALRRLAET
jgi:CheY-like chemotaxis protein